MDHTMWIALQGAGAMSGVVSAGCYRGTSLIRSQPPLGSYRWLMPRVLGGS